MYNSTTYETDSIKSCLDALSQVRLDLTDFIDRFSNKTFAVRKLAKESGLNQKTIRRLLAGENKPTYQTLYNLYRVFLDEEDCSELIKKCPKVIAEEIKNYNPQIKEKRKVKSPHFLELIKKEPVLIELIILAGSSSLHRNQVAYRYGEYGLELLAKLIEMKLLSEVEKDVYCATEEIPQFDGEILKFIGPYFIHRFLSCEDAQVKDHNTMHFYAQGLNEEGKKAWLKCETEAFYKKIEIAQNPKFQGNIPMFTFGAMDSITTSEKS